MILVNNIRIYHIIKNSLKMMKNLLITAALFASAEGFSFVPSSSRSPLYQHSSQTNVVAQSRSASSSSSLQMVDSTIIEGAAIAVAGLAAGIGLLAFTESQGERGKARGGGLSDSMATQIAGKLMEDVEVSSVSDVGSLASQLESALKASGGVDDDKVKELDMTEEEKQKMIEDADDGW